MRCFETAARSAVHRGLAYEKHVQAVLERIGVLTQSTGGSADGGIDLHGTWRIRIPDHHQVQLPVVIQCKNEQKKCGIQYIREFETVLHRQPKNTVGIFAASAGFSVPSCRFLRSIPFPMILATVVDDDIQSFQMNSHAQAVFDYKLVTGSVYRNGVHRLCLIFDGMELVG